MKDKKPHDLECPVCKSTLTEGSLKNYSTWADEIADPNGEQSDYKNRPSMLCKNEKCICGRSNPIGFWDPMGDWYWEKWVDEDNRNTIKTLANGDMTALWGCSRVIFGEKNKQSPRLNLYWMQFYFEWRLKCEPKYGKVVGIKEFKLSANKRDKDGHYYGYRSGLSSLIYYFKRFYNAKKAYETREYNPEYWYVTSIKESFCPPSHHRTDGWYRKFFSWYLNKFERKTYSSIEALELLGEK